MSTGFVQAGAPLLLAVSLDFMNQQYGCSESPSTEMHKARFCGAPPVTVRAGRRNPALRFPGSRASVHLGQVGGVTAETNENCTKLLLCSAFCYYKF